MIPKSFPRRGEYIVDIVNLLLKTNGGRDKRPHFVIFAVWKALIFMGWWWWLEAKSLI